MDAPAFVEKWRRSTRTEKSAAHEHFLDLCELVAHPKPGDVDSTGLTFSTERRVTKAGGGRGYADVFKAGFFAWEYKSRGRDLDDAFHQLLQYSGDLGNPPLFVASDMDRIVVRTHFNGFPTATHEIDLARLAQPRSLDLLRSVFHDPEALRPEKTIERITQEAAAQLAAIAPAVRQRHDDPTEVAHFLDRLVFCLFAEDAGLLPEKVFTRILAKFATRRAENIRDDLADLFRAMARGGDVYGEAVPRFNGDLFDDRPPLLLDAFELAEVHKAAALDWSEMDPSIFGTLFERVMDPAQRSRLGAHYTGFSDIKALVEPVVMTPLRREWDACRARVEALLPDPVDAADAPGLFPAADPAKKAEAQAAVDAFLARLRAVRVLDPACGSGNFLYVALRMLLDLEYEALVFSRRFDLAPFPIGVGPHQLRGIEKNPYAHDLAQMTVWIGYLQWHRAYGFPYHREPILQRLDTIEHKDAILDLTDPDHPAEPSWPEAEFIVGNPPFLGGKKMRTELGDEYVDALFGLWREGVKPEADLCCYWFEKARRQIEAGLCKRAGLIATQGIRGGASREVLKRIKKSGDIYFAESDRNWTVDGAIVHVSMIGFDRGAETAKVLDGKAVGAIHSNLTAAADVTTARRLTENLNIAFMGDTKGGSFDISERLAIGFLDRPNPNGRPNSDVIVPWINGLDVTRRNRNQWIIDFGIGTTIQVASLYEKPFEYINANNRSAREASRSAISNWWLHERPRTEMRSQISNFDKFISTARVTKYRMFVWTEKPTLPDCQVIAFAYSDDFFLGVLHSSVHEIWARSQGTQVRERESGFRYTPTTCFETFPFPHPAPPPRLPPSR